MSSFRNIVTSRIRGAQRSHVNEDTAVTERHTIVLTSHVIHCLAKKQSSISSLETKREVSNFLFLFPSLYLFANCRSTLDLATMTAIKILRDLLPSALHRETPRAKRRKTHSLSCSGMEVEENEQNDHRRNSVNEILSIAPSLLMSRNLADHGMPDRRDPFSMDYLMDFDYDNGNRSFEIPADIVMAIQYGNVDQLIQNYKNRDRLAAQRNLQGETLLHLACRFGSVAIIRSLLCGFKLSAFVLDGQGRSPLHSLCLVMNSSSVNGITNSGHCNHLESMRLLLREKPTLILYKDRHGKVPLDYIQQVNGATNNNSLLWKIVNEMLCSEQIAKRVVQEMLDEVEKSRSGQHMTTWEKINSMIDLSGLDSAIMESGLSM